MKARAAPVTLLPRPVSWLAGATPAVHGSYDTSTAADSGLLPEDVLDFSANGNVIGPAPGVAAAIAQIDPSRYPDRGVLALRMALAARDAVSIDRVVPGSGSTELIWAVARAFLAPGDATVVLGPTYGEYAAASSACGARVETCLACPPGSPINIDSIVRTIGETSAVVAWLCHPNNPTGAVFPLDALEALADRHPATLFAVDEAYVSFSDEIASAVPLIDRGNVVVLRSMTKDGALAGLRVGYALSDEHIAAALRRVQPPWSISSVAQAAAWATLQESGHAERVNRAVLASREHLVMGLQRLGYAPYPSVTNFVLVPVGDGVQVSRGLLTRGVAVRDCTSFGLPQCIRIGVRSMADQERLLAAMTELG
jgi:histidinol-phosphate aminotransferase